MAPETEQALSPTSNPKAPAPPEQFEALVREAVAEVKADRTRLMDVVQAIQKRLDATHVAFGDMFLRTQYRSTLADYVPPRSVQDLPRHASDAHRRTAAV